MRQFVPVSIHLSTTIDPNKKSKSNNSTKIEIHVCVRECVYLHNAQERTAPAIFGGEGDYDDRHHNSIRTTQAHHSRHQRHHLESLRRHRSDEIDTGALSTVYSLLILRKAVKLYDSCEVRFT